MLMRIRFKFGRRNNCNFKYKLNPMQKIKGLKIVRTKSGKPKQLVIDIDKHYDVVEDLLDIIEAENRLNEKTMPAAEVYKLIEAKHKQAKKKA